MLWNLILGSVFCTCAFASSNYNIDRDSAYYMQQMLSIDNFFSIQDSVTEIENAVNEQTGLEHQNDIADKMLDKIASQVKYLYQITKDLANPCRDGIYRNGKCVNYIRVDKFVGTLADAANLCHAHFGEFAQESIIDYSDGPNGGDSGGPYGGGHYGDSSVGGGNYGDATSDGGNYGDATSDGGNYGDATSDGGYYGDVDGEGFSYGDAAGGGAPYGDAAGGGAPYGDAAGGGASYGDSTSDIDVVPLPPPVNYYVCYEPTVVNVPKSIYFPEEEKEEEEEIEDGEEAAPPPFPVPSNEVWFTGVLDPKHDEDECPLFAYNGKVIGDYCYIVYDDPEDWTSAQDVCKARGGDLCEPPGTIAESTAFYSQMKAAFPEEIAEMEYAADPSGTLLAFAHMWLGYHQTNTGAFPFQSQLTPSNPDVSHVAAIFDGSVNTGLPFTLTAALQAPGSSWIGADPATEYPYCCQYNPV